MKKGATHMADYSEHYREHYRGRYRGVYSALFDNMEFQSLSAAARQVLVFARLCEDAGPAAIFRFYYELIQAHTGLSAARVRKALAELVATNWIEIEGPVLWIKNGLRYDPSINLTNRKHLKGVLGQIRSLPKLDIVLRFCIYYDLGKPFESPSNGSVSGSGSGSVFGFGVGGVGEGGSRESFRRRASEAVRTPPPPPPPPAKVISLREDLTRGFELFWQAWPREGRKDEGAARAAWFRLKPSPDLVLTILAAVEKQKHTREWREGYIVYPHRWLDHARWTDEVVIKPALSSITQHNLQVVADAIRQHEEFHRGEPGVPDVHDRDGQLGDDIACTG